MLKKIFVSICLAVLCIFIASPAGAELTAEEIARLGKDLTPMGAEMAGNKDGTIPPWEGGITSPPEGYKQGMHHPDPYADDEILFTITRQNMDKYADQLTPGHKAMLDLYDSFKINVYPTRRSASFPDRI